MKDSEFIELLNLYLDHEISAADAARLEAEVRSNLERRRVYRQYCQMQQACKAIAADFTTEEAAPAVGEKKVVPIASAAPVRHPLRLPYLAGALAAAACVALVFVGRRAPDTPAGSGDAVMAVADSAPAPAASGGMTVAESTANASRGLVSVPGSASGTTLVANPLYLTGSTQAEALRAAAVRQADNQLAWIEAMQLAPLPERPMGNPLNFSERLIIEGRALGHRAGASARHLEPGEEMVTFRFVK